MSQKLWFVCVWPLIKAPVFAKKILVVVTVHFFGLFLSAIDRPKGSLQASKLHCFALRYFFVLNFHNVKIQFTFTQKTVCEKASCNLFSMLYFLISFGKNLLFLKSDFFRTNWLFTFLDFSFETFQNHFYYFVFSCQLLTRNHWHLLKPQIFMYSFFKIG